MNSRLYVSSSLACKPHIKPVQSSCAEGLSFGMVCKAYSRETICRRVIRLSLVGPCVAHVQTDDASVSNDMVAVPGRSRS